MSSSGNQFVFVKGELRIDGSSGYKESNALISFVGDFQTKLGQIRCYGFGPNSFLLLDGSATQGIVFRSTQQQGDAYYLGGAGDQFIFEVLPTKVRAKRLQVELDSNSVAPSFDGSSIFQIIKANTTNAPYLRNSIADITLNTWRVGETMQMTLGASTYSGTSAWSYTMPTSTSSSSADNYSSLSMLRNGTYYENMRMLTTGDVIFPYNLTCNNKITATTIEATNWIGLPPAPTPDLTPITLDNINNRVGINHPSPTHTLQVGGDVQVDGGLAASTLDATSGTIHTLNASSIPPLSLDSTNHRVGINITPTEALHVSGNGLFTGTITGGTVSATTYIGLPTPNVAPITLDTTNNRVGVNVTTPTVDLDVAGDIKSGNAITSLTLTTGEITAGKMTLNGDPIDTLDVTGSGTFSGVVTANTISATNYVGLPPPNVLPLTLDVTNNRVGINKTGPIYALDVNGTIQTNQNYRIQNNAVLTATTLGSGVVNSSLTSVGVLNGVTVNGNIVGYNAAQTAVGYQLGYPIPAWFIHYATSDDKFYIGPCDSSGTADFTKGLDIARDTGHVNVKSQLTANTINATTYLNLPPANVSPLVLDAANTRVGVGVTPLYTIDADVGTVKSGKNVIGDAISTSGIQHVRNDPENSVDMPPGSIVMHQNGSVWRKNTGNTSTGWRPLSIPVPTSSFRSTNLVLSGYNTVQNVASIAVDYDGNPRTWMVTAYLVISGNGVSVNEVILWGIQSANNSLAADATSSVNKLKNIRYSTGNILYDSMTVIFHNSTGLTNIYLNAQGAFTNFTQFQYTTQCGIVLVPLN